MDPTIDLLGKYKEIPKTRVNLWVWTVHIWSENQYTLKPTSTNPVDKLDETLLIVF